MSRQEAIEEYAKALKLGQKEYKDRQSKGKDPNPLVLTELIGSFAAERAIANRIFLKFLSTLIATALAFLAVRLGWIPSVDKIIIGNIMSLIPGIGLTNALRDLFTGDSIAGILRFTETMLTALAIAAGYFLVVILGGILV
jgi:uncharacterized membrane protein YjjB (DUF3815 family)